MEGDAELRPRRPSRRRGTAIVSGVLGTLLIAGVAGGGIWLVNHPQPIIDQITVWQAEPSSVIEEHIERLQLTDHGRFLYLASQPVVSGSEKFAEECPKDAGEEEFGILGCYLPASKTIFLFDVTDERLDGAEEVVAAHEMLHAAWDRMGEGEHRRLGDLLEVEAAKHTDDPAFAARLEFYERTEPGQRANELHSIMATEIPELSAELEEYYAKYFEDRSVVTGLHASSHAVFVQLKAQADQLVAEMTTLRESTESDYAAYTDGYAQLNKDIDTFNANANSGYYGSQSAFTADRNELVTRGDELDELYASILARVDQYQTLADQLTQVNETSTELQRGLNIGGDVSSEPAETPAP